MAAAVEVRQELRELLVMREVVAAVVVAVGLIKFVVAVVPNQTAARAVVVLLLWSFKNEIRKNY
jgi:hypothetical protein